MSDNQTGVYAAVAAVMGELAKEGISKDRRATGVATYNFRGIDDVYNALATLLSKNSLVILPRVLSRAQSERTTKGGGVIVYTVVEVEYDIVCATDGSRHTVRTIGEAMDTSDKSTNKAMSAAYKYMAFQAFCIPTEGDNDADATSDPLPPKGQPARPAQQQRNDPPPRQDKQPETPFDDAPQEQQQDKKAAFWSRASLQLRAEGPEAFATSFCNALYASPSHEQHMRLIRDNNNHIAALPAESEKRVNEAITKRNAFWSQHPTGVQRGAA